SLDDAERAAHRSRANSLLGRPLIGVARVDEQLVNVAAEAFLQRRIRDRRSQHFFDVPRDTLAREAKGGEGLVHVTATNQIEHDPRFRGGGRDVFCGGVRLNCHYPPAFGAAAPAAGAPGAAAATAAALSLLVVCPLNCRVGANSPSLWPTMFSVT